ncbi:MAG TPA: DUF2062 domain-containing protein [Thermodesulfobacteriota bacterium]|nr:DUF2062 domain-containing protein [Thermodesulfobacteriota bacterium]
MERRRPRDRSFLDRWKRQARLYYLRLLRLQDQPSKVAWGMAIGVAIGLTPTIPFHTVLAVAIAFLLRKSKLAAAIGVWVANPLVFPFIYAADYRIGLFITGAESPSLDFSEISPASLLDMGWDLAYPLLAGGALTAALSLLPAYYVTKKAVLAYRARKGRGTHGVGLPSQAA